jgi:pimeloyl-ACP methyl ester carboxylesterase
MDDVVVQALSALTGTVRRGEVRLAGRALRWVEAGSGRPTVICGAALGEPGSLAWAGVMPLVAAWTRVLAYDRAGIGASDPVTQLSLAAQTGDLAAVIREAGNPPCILVGHSLGGLFALLVAMAHPDLVSGLVLVDPADEQFLAALPPEEARQGITLGETVLSQYADGTLAGFVRDTFRPFARSLTDDPQIHALILDAYVSCYAKESQARMVRDEHQLMFGSLPVVRRLRAEGSLPDVPVIVLSATTGSTTMQQRELYTSYHAALAASVPRGRHIVLADTSHAINQERPGDIAEAIKEVIEEIQASAPPLR